MTAEKLEELLLAGEGFTIEYKECVNGLNNSVFETVCSFSNRYGGYLLLGAIFWCIGNLQAHFLQN